MRPGLKWDPTKIIAMCCQILSGSSMSLEERVGYKNTRNELYRFQDNESSTWLRVKGGVRVIFVIKQGSMVFDLCYCKGNRHTCQ